MGVNILNAGTNLSYWKFWDPTIKLPPPNFSLVKLIWSTPVDLSAKLGLPEPLGISKKYELIFFKDC